MVIYLEKARELSRIAKILSREGKLGRFLSKCMINNFLELFGQAKPTKLSFGTIYGMAAGRDIKMQIMRNDWIRPARMS